MSSQLIAILVVVVVFLSFCAHTTNGTLTITDEIIEQICVNTRDPQGCRDTMTAYRFTAGTSVPRPFEIVAAAFISEAEYDTNETIRRTSMLLGDARLDDHELRLKYFEGFLCYHKCAQQFHL